MLQFVGYVHSVLHLFMLKDTNAFVAVFRKRGSVGSKGVGIKCKRALEPEDVSSVRRQ